MTFMTSNEFTQVINEIYKKDVLCLCFFIPCLFMESYKNGKMSLDAKIYAVEELIFVNIFGLDYLFFNMFAIF